MRRALYLNKFGIMHKGLVRVVKDIDDAPDIDEIVLGICSSQFNDKNKSPEKDWIYNCLSWEERKEVMRAALRDINKQIHYIPIPDTFPISKTFPENPWIDMLMTKVPEFDVMYSERDVEIECMQARSKEIRGITKHVAFSDHCIRDKIARREKWMPYFDYATGAVLAGMDIEGRYESLFQKVKEPKNADFEWRSIAPQIPGLSMRNILMDPHLDGLIKHIGIQKYTDNYVFSLTRTDVNMKLTADNIKVKLLKKTQNKIERYVTSHIAYSNNTQSLTDLCKRTRFPMIPGVDRLNPDVILDCVYALGFNPYLMHAEVEKTREMYTYENNGKLAGIEHVIMKQYIMGNEMLGNSESLAIESKHIELVGEIQKILGVDVMSAHNYIQWLENESIQLYEDEIFKNMFMEGDTND